MKKIVSSSNMLFIFISFASQRTTNTEVQCQFDPNINKYDEKHVNDKQKAFSFTMYGFVITKVCRSQENVNNKSSDCSDKTVTITPATTK